MEKRRHQRFAIPLPVTIRHKGRLLPATALNISAGGMLLETGRENFSKDAHIEVTFDLDKEHRDVSLCGVIAREDHTRIGVQFGSRFSSGYKILSEFLRKS